MPHLAGETLPGTVLERTEYALVHPDRIDDLPIRKKRISLAPYFLLIPAVIALLLALAYPLGRQVIMSFQEFGLAQQIGTAPPEWVGLANYKTSLLFAWAMPVVAAMTVWQWLFDTEYGVVNWFLTKVGLDFYQHSWLIEPLSFYFVATVIIVWMSVPFVVFSVYAALTQVSEEVLEASELDGASGLQRFMYIIFPTIAPVIAVVSVLQIIWDLRVFTQIYYLQGAGGLASKTDLLGTYLYRLGISQANYGVASAVALFMLFLTLVITSWYIRNLLKETE